MILGNKNIDQMVIFTYLDSNINKDCECSQGVNSRIAKGVFLWLKMFQKNKKISLQT